mmetsp:Transcript_38749/g.91785  ORF Transcript_38749/g.91785 Transcript_38749/m.91785 type:complete len:237 (+) Transcript_38749:365-1075(+)
MQSSTTPNKKVKETKEKRRSQENKNAVLACRPQLSLRVTPASVGKFMAEGVRGRGNDHQRRRCRKPRELPHPYTSLASAPLLELQLRGINGCASALSIVWLLSRPAGLPAETGTVSTVLLLWPRPLVFEGFGLDGCDGGGGGGRRPSGGWMTPSSPFPLPKANPRVPSGMSGWWTWATSAAGARLAVSSAGRRVGLSGRGGASFVLTTWRPLSSPVFGLVATVNSTRSPTTRGAPP